jgi:tetratricopeptide (TPR) repeat protein
METLTPVQRVAVVTIGLTMTAIIAVIVLPWASKQIEARLPPTSTPLPATATSPPIPTRSPTATPSQAMQLTPPPAQILLDPMLHVQQTAGNNGPACLEIVLSYWGYTDTQEIIRASVQPGELDISAEPEELAEYVQSRQLASYVGVNGDAELLRQFLANQFPVLVTRWMMTTEGTETKRYQVVRGYDRQADTFTLHDPGLEPDIEISAADLDASWRAANRQYLLAFPPQHEERFRALLDLEENEMWEGALAQAEREAVQDEGDAYAWLNQAHALAALGRCEETIRAFDRAQELGVSASLLSFQFRVYECMIGLEDYDRVLALTQEAIDGGAILERLYLYRAQAYAAQGDMGQARAEYQRALDIHPGWAPAEEGLEALPE